MKRLVIFDLDDTLYPEIEFVKSGFREVANVISQDFGFKVDEIYDLLMDAFNKDRKFVFNRVLELLGINNETYLNKIISMYRNHKPEIHLYSDAKAVLPLLKKNFLLGLVTDGFPSTQRLKVVTLNIEKYFDKAIYTWEKGESYSKPSILPFKDMLDEFQLGPEEAIYVGDNIEKDFKGPKNLGMLSVRVIRKEGIYKDAVSPGIDFEPDYTVNSLIEFVDLLTKIP
ncbi:MAG TPA: HAD-IA family hydrolase [Dictyoglomaceae bacterium]|nr:HAD-IA family hydrolase [Dictyoglomaceae bacterium]